MPVEKKLLQLSYVSYATWSTKSTKVPAAVQVQALMKPDVT